MKDRDQVLRLMDPLQTSKYCACNRFLRSATYLAAADDASGGISGLEIGRMSEIAAGGTGSIVSGFAYISKEGKTAPRQWGLHCDERIGDVRRLSQSVRRSGAKLIVQISHAGGQQACQYGKESLTSSGLPHPTAMRPTKALTIDGIEEIIGQFAAAAARAKEGGADAVEVHGGHGFLLTQFLSPVINRRDDSYGGSLENRARLYFETYRAIRKTVGEDYPVWFKVSVAEGLEDGYQAADGLYVCKELLKLGADGIEISSGTSYADAHHIPSMIGVSAGESEAPFKAYAREIKRHVAKDQVVTLTGGLRSLEVMGALFAEGYCDLFGLSRPLVAEADLVNRWYEEDARPAACISCNACSKTAAKGPINCPIWRDRYEGNWDPL